MPEEQQQQQAEQQGFACDTRAQALRRQAVSRRRSQRNTARAAAAARQGNREPFRVAAADPPSPGPPAKFPEPRPRIAAVSSGLSLWAVPLASVEQIKQSCAHYEAKCAANDAKAKRYLLELSREVQSQLDQLCQSASRQQQQREQLLVQLKQFEELFATTLSSQRKEGEDSQDAQGITEDVPTLLNSILGLTLEQRSRISEMEKDAEQLKQAKAASEGLLHKSLSDHQAVAREGLRQQMAQMREEHAAQMRQQQLMHKEEITKMRVEMVDRAFVESMKAEFEGAEGRYRQQIDRLVGENQQSLLECQRSLLASKQAWEEEVSRVHEQQRATVQAISADAARKQQEADQAHANSLATIQSQCDQIVKDFVQRVEQDTNIETTRQLMAENGWLRNRVAGLEQLIDCMQQTIRRAEEQERKRHELTGGGLV
jgi:hypothetical protein